MTIPDFEVWQQSECCSLGITVEEHNQILEVLNKMSLSGGSNNYDVFINAIRLPSKSLTARFLDYKSPIGDPDGPWDTGEDEDENSPYGR